MKLPNNYTTLEILGIAARAEIAAAQYYKKIKSVVHSPALKDKLTFLVNEELKHKRMIEDYCRQKFPGIEMAPAPSSLVPKPMVPNGKVTVSTLLKAAMKAELEAEKFYLSLAGNIGDISGSLLLKYMAKVENSHYQILKNEVELIDQGEKIKELKTAYQTDKAIHIGP